MSSPITKFASFLLLVQLITTQLYAGNNFPNSIDYESFKIDLRKSALISNLPNNRGTDYYVGVSGLIGMINSHSGDYQTIPGLRVSIYPNPGYNLWAQFAQWSGDRPNFSVGTGVQVAFQGENLRNGQSLGTSWNKIYGSGYSQRDISIHGIYTRFSDPLDFGLMVIYNTLHVLVDNITGFQSYDETQMMIVPYISWILTAPMKVSLQAPMGKSGIALTVDMEWLIGKRD